jgi:hypothetical protein
LSITSLNTSQAISPNSSSFKSGNTTSTSVDRA